MRTRRRRGHSMQCMPAAVACHPPRERSSRSRRAIWSALAGSRPRLETDAFEPGLDSGNSSNMGSCFLAHPVIKFEKHFNDPIDKYPYLRLQKTVREVKNRNEMTATPPALS